MHPEMSPEELRASALVASSSGATPAPELSPAVRVLSFSSHSAASSSIKRSRTDDGFARAIIDSVSAAQRENARLTLKLADAIAQLRSVVDYSRQLRAALEEADAVQTILEDAVARASNWEAHPLSLHAQKVIVELRERIEELESAAVFSHIVGAVGGATPLISETAAPAAPLVIGPPVSDTISGAGTVAVDDITTGPTPSEDADDDKEALLESAIRELVEVRKSSKAASIRMQDSHAEEIATLKEAHAHAIARMMRPARSDLMAMAAI